MSFVTSGTTLYVARPTSQSRQPVVHTTNGFVLVFVGVPVEEVLPVFDPFADPLLPIHVTQLVPGVQIRISLKGGHQMVPKTTKRGNFLVPNNKRRSRRGYEKVILLGAVVSNSPESGQLSMNVYDEVSRQTYRADVKYTSMAILQRSVQITTIVETAINPGTVAIGTKHVGGQLLNPRVKLVRIKF